MRIPLYQVDAFTRERFHGNPAAVCPLDRWLPDATLLAIAAENNLSETAFFVPRGDDFDLRWFTPRIEVDLCGHATLAAAYVLFHRLNFAGPRVTFHTQSGPLMVTRDGTRLVMDFPSWPAKPCASPLGLTEALGRAPRATFLARDLVALFDDEATVRALSPNFSALAEVDAFGVVATAPGGDIDFVSRYFVPRAGISEDPVTGSTHSTLTPFWAERLGKTRLTARQVSARTGELECELLGDRVGITGDAVLYLEGTIEV